MTTKNQKVPKNLFESMNTENKRFLQSLIRSEDTAEIVNNLTDLWSHLVMQPWTNPQGWLEMINKYQQDQFEIWTDLMNGTVNFQAPKDRRFDSDEWSKLPAFNFIKQSYLLTADLLRKSTDAIPLDEKERVKLKFYTQYFIDAMSPSNFINLNPDVITEAMKTDGQSLIDGLQNLLSDLEKGRITMTDESAFTLGENIGVSRGSVVFRNHLFELIQYRPTTENVYQRPLLIVPPCINKFYILDLQPQNSFVKWCVDQGNTVFLISWVNTTPEYSHVDWDDYVQDGVFEATRIVKEITDEKKLNAVAWCIGGTILASALAVMQKRLDQSVGSVTLLTTLLDFAEPGDLGVFLDKEEVDFRATQIAKEGVMSGKNLSLGFNMIRSNELIWSYFVNNYLKGKMPPPFDLLYWNSDPTNLPAAMYNTYVSEMYIKNNLAKPRGFTCCGEPVELNKIKIPMYFFSAIDDHIAPWKSTFSGTELLGGSLKFVLGGSGHIAGVINPPAKNKRNYWTNGELGQGPDHWFETATDHLGSWWTHWHEWLNEQDDRQVPARQIEIDGEYKEIVPAPGDYVRVRL
ncbi:MAG: class I poly(R)-hydroxyalkanoic acid synthase [Gammaproteobacteria bacterium]|nr:class I poly(R)-hydroxyalkanoic acid synthase [Gammaproteobacteria bacterium]